jgi:hypothetical protein
LYSMSFTQVIVHGNEPGPHPFNKYMFLIRFTIFFSNIYKLSVSKTLKRPSTETPAAGAQNQ